MQFIDNSLNVRQFIENNLSLTFFREEINQKINDRINFYEDRQMHFTMSVCQTNRDDLTDYMFVR
jgi:hypothetical protein